MRNEKQIAAKLKDGKTCIPSTKNTEASTAVVIVIQTSSSPSTQNGSPPHPVVLLSEHANAHLSKCCTFFLSQPPQQRWEMSQELGRHSVKTLIFFATWAHVGSSSTRELSNSTSRSRKPGVSEARDVRTSTAPPQPLSQARPRRRRRDPIGCLSASTSHGQTSLPFALMSPPSELNHTFVDPRNM